MLRLNLSYSLLSIFIFNGAFVFSYEQLITYNFSSYKALVKEMPLCKFFCIFLGFCGGCLMSFVLKERFLHIYQE